MVILRRGVWASFLGQTLSKSSGRLKVLIDGWQTAHRRRYSMRAGPPSRSHRICFDPKHLFRPCFRRRTNAADSFLIDTFRINRGVLHGNAMENVPACRGRNPRACQSFNEAPNRAAANPFHRVVKNRPPQAGQKRRRRIDTWSSAGRLSLLGVDISAKTGRRMAGPLYLKPAQRRVKTTHSQNYRANARFWVGRNGRSICCIERKKLPVNFSASPMR